MWRKKNEYWEICNKNFFQKEHEVRGRTKDKTDIK